MPVLLYIVVFLLALPQFLIPCLSFPQSGVSHSVHGFTTQREHSPTGDSCAFAGKKQMAKNSLRMWYKQCVRKAEHKSHSPAYWIQNLKSIDFILFLCCFFISLSLLKLFHYVYIRDLWIRVLHQPTEFQPKPGVVNQLTLNDISSRRDSCWIITSMFVLPRRVDQVGWVCVSINQLLTHSLTLSWLVYNMNTLFVSKSIKTSWGLWPMGLSESAANRKWRYTTKGIR
jgi:hypothetical protein